MRRRPAQAAAAGYALIDAAVILGPSVVLAAAAEKGGVADLHGLDLIIASAVIAAVHARLAYRRMIAEIRAAVRVTDAWIAAINALVVLALAVVLVLLAVLGGFADEHAVLVGDGWPVVGLWVGVQLAAVAAAEITGWLVFRWLEPSAGSRGPA